MTRMNRRPDWHPSYGDRPPTRAERKSAQALQRVYDPSGPVPFPKEPTLYRKAQRRRYLKRRERTAWLTLIGCIIGAFYLVLCTSIYWWGQPVMGILALPFIGASAWAMVTLAELDKTNNP